MSAGEKLTRQGVRDLGGNNQSKRDTCQHWFGPEHVIGRELSASWSSDYGDRYQHIPVYGRTCVYCQKVKRVDH